MGVVKPVVIASLILVLTCSVWGQVATTSLRGTVFDEKGAWLTGRRSQSTIPPPVSREPLRPVRKANMSFPRYHPRLTF